MNDQLNHVKSTDEITLKELILTIQDYAKEIVRKWWIVALVTFLCVGYFMYKHYTHIDTYPASVKFMAQGGGSGAVGGLLGQFGLGGIQAPGLSPFKVVEVTSSGRILKNVLSTKVDNQFIGNLIIEEYSLDDAWAKSNPDYTGFRFKGDTMVINSSKEKVAFKRLSSLIWSGAGNNELPIMAIGYNNDNGIYKLSANTRSSKLTGALLDNTYYQLKYFFEHEVLANRIQAIDILRQKLDSLNSIRESKNYEIAAFDDRNRNVITKTASAKRNILQQDFLAASSAYAEVMKNKDLADFNMKSNAPLFIEVDRSLEPLSPLLSKIKKKLILGISCGIFISVFFISLSILYRNVMKG